MFTCRAPFFDSPTKSCFGAGKRDVHGPRGCDEIAVCPGSTARCSMRVHAERLLRLRRGIFWHFSITRRETMPPIPAHPNPNLDRPRSQFAMYPSRALASRFLLAERHAQRVVAASSQWLRAAIRLAHAPPLAGDLLRALDAALSLAGNLRERCSSRTSRKSPNPRARAKSVWLARICRRCVAFEGWLARRADRALSACRRQLLVPRRELATSVTQLLRFGIRHAYAEQHGTSQTRTG